MNIKRFKQDHTLILSAVAELKSLVKRGIPENSDAIVKAIASMSSTIGVHLSAEDRFLYPWLANSADPAVVQLGARFQHAMGHIAIAYTEFVDRWSNASDVAADPERFRTDANSIYKALHQRIQRENQELYPLIEQGKRPVAVH